MENCTIEIVDDMFNNNNTVLSVIDQDDLTNIVTDSPIPGDKKQLYQAQFTKLGHFGFLLVS